MGKMHLGKDDVEKIISWLKYADNSVKQQYIINAENDDEHDSGIEYHNEIQYLLYKLEK